MNTDIFEKCNDMTRIFVLFYLLLFLIVLSSCKTYSYETKELDHRPFYGSKDIELFQYIASNFKIPEDYGEKGIPGHIIVKFAVNENGKLTSFKVLKICVSQI